MRHDRSELGAIPAAQIGSPVKPEAMTYKLWGSKETLKKSHRPSPKEPLGQSTKYGARLCLYKTSDKKLTTPQVNPCHLPLALSFKNFLLTSQTILPHFPHSGTNLTLSLRDSPSPTAPLSAHFQLKYHQTFQLGLTGHYLKAGHHPDTLFSMGSTSWLPKIT